jgi:hypothetical protein
MTKKIILSGFMGGIAMSVWMFVVNGLFRFSVHMNMKTLANEPEVYELLKASVLEPGRYVVNPTVNPQIGFPLNEPVFGLTYSGFGHEAAGPLMLVGLVTMFGVTILAAWMLSRTSLEFRSGYVRRILFFTAIGLLFAISIDLGSFGIAGRPLTDALILGLHRILMWTFVGVVAAWFMKGESAVPE